MNWLIISLCGQLWGWRVYSGTEKCKLSLLTTVVKYGLPKYQLLINTKVHASHIWELHSPRLWQWCCHFRVDVVVNSGCCVRCCCPDSPCCWDVAGKKAKCPDHHFLCRVGLPGSIHWSRNKIKTSRCRPRPAQAAAGLQQVLSSVSGRGRWQRDSG